MSGISLFDVYLQSFATLLVGVILFAVGKIYQWTQKVDHRLDIIEQKINVTPRD